MSDALAAIALSVPGGRVENCLGARLILSGLPFEALNVAFAPPRLSDTEEVIDRAERLFDGHRVPWRFEIPAERATVLGPLLNTKGLTEVERQPGMFMPDLDRPMPPTPRGLTIRRVEGCEETRRFMATGREGFGLPYIKEFDELSLDGTLDVTGYLGWIGEKPVATSMRFTASGVAGVLFVSTLPEYRRRGFGAAMTWRAALEGRHEGCRASFLQASEMGYPVYERMGYRTIVETLSYRHPEP
ncbi:MAG: GNAT family N-acetyltransferase [Thermoplasmata archaeon]|nr:GNAT family N-acetyltransferase [Thermoplasmata archaeon]